MHSFRRPPVWIWIVIFALIGASILIFAFAAGQSATIEAEQATNLTAGASVVTSTGASGGKAVQFGSTASATPTPAPTSIPVPTVGPVIGGSDVSSCPATGQVNGAPSGNTFAGQNYNGNHQTISGSFTVQANACISNYTINGTLNLAAGASNITIVNNKFNPNGAQRDIANAVNGGSNITINYNTFNPSTGGASVFGRGGVTNITLNHNLFNGADNIDGAQLQCPNVCTNLVMSYNRFTNMQSYAVELQQVVHGETFSYNYADFSICGTNPKHGCGGQYSISQSSEIDDNIGGHYYTTSSSNVKVNNNIAILAPAIQTKLGGACFEVRGTGFTLDHNYCLHYHSLCEFANTNSPYNSVPWFTTNNTVVGSGAGDCWQEGTNASYAQPGYPNIAPTPILNTNTSDSGNYPQPPAWNYANGAQW